MIKPTPNPPETDTTSPYETLDSKKFHEAAERALDHYLNPFHPRKPLLKPNTRYLIAPGIPSEELLADACETLTCAKTMASDFAGMLDAPQWHVLLGMGQLIMLAELEVNRVLDNLEVAAGSAVLCVEKETACGPFFYVEKRVNQS